MMQSCFVHTPPAPMYIAAKGPVQSKVDAPLSIVRPCLASLRRRVFSRLEPDV